MWFSKNVLPLNTIKSIWNLIGRETCNKLNVKRKYLHFIHVLMQGHLKKMDWKVTRKFFRSLNITDRKMFYISFWSFLLHMKTCKKNFWTILIFCRWFCNVFESSTALSKVGVATILLVPCPCNHHHHHNHIIRKIHWKFHEDISIGFWDIQLFVVKGVSFLAKIGHHWVTLTQRRPILAKIEIPWNGKCWISQEPIKIS